MQIGSEMATLQEKKPKMDPKKRFFLKNPPEFWTFENSSWIPISNRFFWPEPIHRVINLVLKCLPAQCELAYIQRSVADYILNILKQRIILIGIGAIQGWLMNPC